MNKKTKIEVVKSISNFVSVTPSKGVFFQLQATNKSLLWSIQE
jgi:hypothetical protein